MKLEIDSINDPAQYQQLEQEMYDFAEKYNLLYECSDGTLVVDNFVHWLFGFHQFGRDIDADTVAMYYTNEYGKVKLVDNREAFLRKRKFVVFFLSGFHKWHLLGVFAKKRDADAAIMKKFNEAMDDPAMRKFHPPSYDWNMWSFYIYKDQKRCSLAWQMYPEILPSR